MRHGKQLSKNRSLDGTIIKEESDNKVQEKEMLHSIFSPSAFGGPNGTRCW